MTLALGFWVFALVYVGAVSWALRWRRAHPAAPPRPDTLRHMLERNRMPKAASAVYLAIKLALVGAGVLLLVAAQQPIGRLLGAMFVATLVLPMVWGTWYLRSGRLEAARRRALVRSEEFWSQPDAEAQARAMRRARFSRSG